MQRHERSGLYALLPRRLLRLSSLCASACPSPRPPVPCRAARSCRAGGGGGAEACRPSDTWRRWRAASRWRRWPSQGRPAGADGGSEGPRHTIRARLQGMPPLQPASPCRRPAVLPSRPRLALSLCDGAPPSRRRCCTRRSRTCGSTRTRTCRCSGCEPSSPPPASSMTPSPTSCCRPPRAGSSRRRSRRCGLRCCPSSRVERASASTSPARISELPPGAPQARVDCAAHLFPRLDARRVDRRAESERGLARRGASRPARRGAQTRAAPRDCTR